MITRRIQDALATAAEGGEMKIRLGAGRLFGLIYLAAWGSALVALIYFMSVVPRYVAIIWGLVIFLLSPDIKTLKLLLSGKEDESARDGH